MFDGEIATYVGRKVQERLAGGRRGRPSVFRYLDPVSATGAEVQSLGATKVMPDVCVGCDYLPACRRVEDWYVERFATLGAAHDAVGGGRRRHPATMTSLDPQVTVVCATYNGREAVRLTLASFRRHTPEPCVVLVADNGSTDGTVEELGRHPWLTVVPFEQRAAGLSEHDRRRARAHGRTLDWLAAQVETPYFITLDSDVEFLGSGWLSRMLAVAERDALVAVGELEPAVGGYRSRLAPYLLLLRTDAFRSLGTSFAGYATFEDADDAERFRHRPPALRLDASELEAYPTAKLYPTAAGLFEELARTGARWGETPAVIRALYRHIGHMSWGDRDEPVPGQATFRAEYLTGLDYVRQRLRLYESRP